MAIPTEAIGSIPRPQALIDTMVSFQAGRVSRDVLDAAYHDALKDTIRRLEETGSPVLSDGEQTKPRFCYVSVERAAESGVGWGRDSVCRWAYPAAAAAHGGAVSVWRSCG